MSQEYPASTWRLVLSAPADGPTHMAMDEAVWESVAEGLSGPTLRLYAWQPPCLSLGRHQPLADVNQDALRAAGYDLVRRPTGGRAILHTDELTYSVSVPLSDPRVRGGVLASCQSLSQGLLVGLRDVLGVPGVAAHVRSGPSAQQPVCFETPGDFEIVVGGRKLVGSAQMRARDVLLQHGTLPLWGDVARICRYLAPPADADRVRQRAATLEEALGRRVAWEEAAQAVAEGFSRALNVRLELGQLTDREEGAVKRLCEEKHCSAEWTDK